MDRKELEELLMLLRKYEVEAFAHKDTQITFRFPKKDTAQAVIVVNPQDQVDSFDSSDEDEVEVQVEDKSGLSSLPPVYRKLYRAVPRRA